MDGEADNSTADYDNSSTDNCTTDCVIYYTRPNASLAERLAIGGTYCLLTSAFLFLQCSILIIFFSYKDYYKNMCYRIMIVISLVDSVQLCVHFYGGVIAICNSALNPWMEKILGGLLNSFCIALFPLCLVLAIDRLLVYLPRLISSRAEPRLIVALIFLSFAWAFPFFVAYMTTHSAIVFRSYAWCYDDQPSAERWDFVQTVDESSTLPILGVNFVIYLSILGILIYKRRTKTLNRGNYSGWMAPHEKRLLIQSLIHFCLELSLNTLWLFQAMDIISGLSLNEAAINLYWIIFNGIKPILYLIFNTPIRERTFRLWRCLGPESLVVSSQQLLEARRTTLPQVAPRLGQPSLWLSPRPHIDRLKMDKEIRYSNGKIEISNSSIGGGSSFGLPGEQPRRQPRKAFGQQQQQQM